MNPTCPICHNEMKAIYSISNGLAKYILTFKCAESSPIAIVHEVLIFKDGYWLISEGDLTLTYDPEINVTAMSINNIQNISFNLKIEFENATPILDKYKKLKAFS